MEAARMMKKLMGLAVLSGVLGGGVMAMTIDREGDETKVDEVIDARLHQLLVKMNADRR
jgi:hypothetical protein